MADANMERLGLKGILATVESGLRLVGGANATGALAAGAALHAFKDNAAALGTVKLSGMLFLFGVLFFAAAYTVWFVMTVNAHLWVRRSAKDVDPERILFRPHTPKTLEKLQKTAGDKFRATFFLGLVSVLCFGLGMAGIVAMAVAWQFS